MRWRRLAAALAGALLAPGAAHAHLVTTGLGPVYDGISHLLLSFDDLLPVVALALLGGLHGPGGGRRVLFALPAVWLAAGLAGLHSGVAPAPLGLAAPSLLLLGGLVAADLRLPAAALTGLALALGGLHGFLNGAALAADGRDASGLVGIAVATFVLAALVSAAVAALRAPAGRIAVRVAGSWIAAIGLLLAGWALRA